MNIKFSIKRMLQITIMLTLTALTLLAWVMSVQQSRIHVNVKHEEQQVNAIFALKDTRYFVVQIQQFLTDVGATKSDEAKSEALESKQSALEHIEKLIQYAPEFTVQAQNIKRQVNSLHDSGIKMADAYLTQGTDAGNLLMKSAGGFDDAAGDLADNLDLLAQKLDQQFILTVNETLRATVKSSNWSI
jgi:methyl-accepting chemotaxis protein